MNTAKTFHLVIPIMFLVASCSDIDENSRHIGGSINGSWAVAPNPDCNNGRVKATIDGADFYIRARGSADRRITIAQNLSVKSLETRLVLTADFIDPLDQKEEKVAMSIHYEDLGGRLVAKAFEMNGFQIRPDTIGFSPENFPIFEMVKCP